MKHYRRLQIQLSAAEKREIEGLLSRGVQQVRVVLRALALRQLSTGQRPPQVAHNLDLSPKAVRAIGARFEKEGLAGALYEKQRPGPAPIMAQDQQQRIVAMICGQPPAGRARWTVRLIVAEAVKRKLVPKVGRETIRMLLEHHDLKPWREKNVVRGEDR
jgi:putative transposase